MKQLKNALFASLLCFAFFQTTNAQELLSELPSTKEEFISSEKKVLATIDWLENTPMNQEQDKRKVQNALLIAWLTNSPTVTLEINADILTFTKKNPELIVIFMGGWTRYSLLNDYSSDTVNGSIAGIKSAIKVYKTGFLKKDKEMEKLIQKDENNELENWAKKALGK